MGGGPLKSWLYSELADPCVYPCFYGVCSIISSKADLSCRVPASTGPSLARFTLASTGLCSIVSLRAALFLRVMLYSKLKGRFVSSGPCFYGSKVWHALPLFTWVKHTVPHACGRPGGVSQTRWRVAKPPRPLANCASTEEGDVCDTTVLAAACLSAAAVLVGHRPDGDSTCAGVATVRCEELR